MEWQIENAKLFKKPIPYRGRQGLFDVPELNTNNLPEVYDFPKIKRDGTSLELPLNAEIFGTLNDYESVQLYLTEANLPFFADEDLNALPTQSVSFVNAATGERRECSAKGIAIDPVLEEDTNDPVLFYDPNGNELALYTVDIMY